MPTSFELTPQMMREIIMDHYSAPRHKMNPKDEGMYQLDLFTDYDALDKERRMQRALLEVRQKYGSNALLRGFNYMNGGTARERNLQIGGHKA